MDLLFFVIAIIFGILQIVLFFKVWGMCNNVERIADKFAPQYIPETNNTSETAKADKQAIDNIKFKYMRW